MTVHGYHEAVYLREVITAISLGVLRLCSEKATVVGLSAFHIRLLPRVATQAKEYMIQGYFTLNSTSRFMYRSTSPKELLSDYVSTLRTVATVV